MIIGFFDSLAYLTLTWGFGATSQTSIVTMLSATYPLPTLMLARIFLKEKLTANQWLGIILIIGGSIFLAGSG